MFWLTSIVILLSIKSINAETCDEKTHTAIYAADNLANGTVRLYSNFDYYDLLLYWDTSASPSSFVFHKWNQSRLSAVVESAGDVRHTYGMWNHSVAVLDSDTYHSAIVSLHDQLGHEYTIFYMSEVPQSHTIHPTGYFYYWNTANPMVSNISGFGNSHNETQDQGEFELTTLTAAFRVYINDEQHLFMIVNHSLYQGQFMLKDFTNNEKESISVHQTQYLGSIPTVTAAFAVQPNSTDLWVCLVNCDKYCLVPAVNDSIANKTIFDFSQCADNEAWSTLPPMTATTDLSSEISRIRLVNYPGKHIDYLCEPYDNDIITTRHVAFAIIFLLFLLYSIFLIMKLCRSCSGQKYDVGKAEYRNILRKHEVNSGSNLNLDADQPQDNSV